MSIRKFNVNKTESQIALASAMFPGFMSKEDKIALDALVAANFAGGSITSVTVTMTDITEVQEHLAILDSSVDAIKSKDDTQDSSISSLTTSVNNHNSSIGDLDASIKSVISVNESQKSSIETLTTDYNTLKGRFDNHNTSIGNLDASIKAVISVNESQSDSIGTLTTNYNTLKGRVDTLENSLSTLSNTVNSLKSKLDSYPTMHSSDNNTYGIKNGAWEIVCGAGEVVLTDDETTAASLALQSLEEGVLIIDETTDPEMIEEVRELLGDELFNELATKSASTLELHPEPSFQEKLEQAKMDYYQRKLQDSYYENLTDIVPEELSVIKQKGEVE